MSYMALYRKWRPATFDEVRGQDAIVRTLKNQIIYNRIGHAYLFCGTRGTGKTSIAKLFAKTVNCHDPRNGNPCNECPSCKAINAGNSLNVHEIDAASNNGVDYIRMLRDQIQYSPVDDKYKVYIIDEVHMLSPGAFNALLKTLEEPPSYVIFLLATTEKQKVPVTILSRCQKYDFKRISVDTITRHLVDLMEKENVSAEEKALAYIARAADGSMRDALSLLDQCIAFYLGQTLTYENVLSVLGAADNSVFSKLLRSILRQDSLQALAIIEDIISEGRDLSQFLADFLWYLRNLLILKDQEGAEESLDMSRDIIEGLKEEAQMVGSEELLRYIRILSDLEGQVKHATQKRVLLEVGFIKLCRPEMETSQDSLLARISHLEQQLTGMSMLKPEEMAKLVSLAQADPAALMAAAAQGSGPGGSRRSDFSQGGNPGAGTELESPQDIDAEMEKRFTKAEREDLTRLAENWEDIIRLTGQPLRFILRDYRPYVGAESNTIFLVPHPVKEGVQFFDILAEDKEKLARLSEIVAEETGKIVDFRYSTEGKLHQPGMQPIRLEKLKALQDKIRMPIDIE